MTWGVHFITIIIIRYFKYFFRRVIDVYITPSKYLFTERVQSLTTANSRMRENKLNKRINEFY